MALPGSELSRPHSAIDLDQVLLYQLTVCEMNDAGERDADTGD